jgi:LacI family transcriptional regulator
MTPEAPSVRIRDVAERAGMSPATVSRVLNDSSLVTAETRERVMRAIAELGYRPNRVARNLRLRKVEMIGVVVSDIENPHFTGMVRTVEDAAYDRGYRMLLCNTDEKAEKQRAYLEMLLAERVLGVILSASNPAGEEIGELLDLGIPVVAVDRPVKDPRADSVTTDNLGAGRIATRHLLETGHKRIALVSTPEVVTGLERMAGYEQVMRSASLEPRSAPGYSRVEGGMAATEQLLQIDPPPTALIASNNLVGLGALRVLHDRGLRVPQDIALVMIDDPFWAAILDPPVTALAQPVRKMAECVVELLIDRLSGDRRESRHVVFDVELRVRASTARVD